MIQIRAASSFKVWFPAMTSSSSKLESLANRESRARLCSSKFFLASLLNLCKVLSISRSYYKSPWSEDRVTAIKNQGNSNKPWKTNQEKSRVMKINQNSTLKHKKRLKTLENSGIWPRKGGASNLSQNCNYQKLTIFFFFENFKNEIRITRSTKIN